MIRTSMFLPISLHQQLIGTSRLEGKTFTAFVRELLDQAMTTRRKTHLKHMYTELAKLEGIIDDPATDASTTINQVLYGTPHARKGDYVS